MRKQLKRCLCHLTSLLTVVMMVFTVSCSEDELAAVASVDLDLTSLTFDATSSSQVLTIKSNRMWTLTVDETAQEWLSLSRTSGENDGTVEVTVLANNGDNRSTSIIMIAGGKSTSIQVTQEGANPVTTLWYEPFGTVAVTENTFVDKYDGFAKAGVVGAGVVYTGVTTSVRTSGTASTGAYTGASGVNNLFFGAATASFMAENIVVKGASQLTLTFGATMYAGSTSSDTYSVDAMKVYVKADAGEWKALTYTHAANTSWEQASIDLSSQISSETQCIAIKFECSYASAYRLDDVKLTALGFEGLSEPLVFTTEASDITGDGATLKGSYVNYGAGDVSEKGFMYKTGTGDWVSVQVTTEDFSLILTGLSATTEYTYKAYVVKNGTTYEGGEKKFTTTGDFEVLLNESFGAEAVSGNTDIAAYTNYLRGGLVGAGVIYGGTSVSVRKSAVSSTEDYASASGTNNVYFPTAGGTLLLENIYVSGAKNLSLSFGAYKYKATLTTDDMKVSYSTDGVTWNSITLNFSADDTYWQYITAGMSSISADIISLKFEGVDTRVDDILIQADEFTAPTTPQVMTLAVDEFTSTGATLRGFWANYGGATATEVGFKYKTGSGEWKSIAVDGTAAGSFEKSVSELTAQSVYTYKAYVIAGATYEGTEKTFTTKSAWIPTNPPLSFFSDDFSDATTMENNWFMQHTEGETDWYQNKLNSDYKLYMSSYNTTEVNTCYAVSPTLSLSGATDKVVSFEVWNTYTAEGTVLKAYYSTDFAGDVTTCSKQELSISLPETTTGTATAAYNYNIDLSSVSGETVYIIFEYKGSKADSKTTNYGIDNFVFGKRVSLLKASQTSFSVAAEGKSDLSFNVNAVDAAWIATASESWITTSVSDAAVSFSVAANAGAARVGTIILTAAGVDGVVVTISQAAAVTKTVVYSENVGATEVSSNTNLADFTGWNNTSVSYSVDTVLINIRKSSASSGYDGASGGNSVFFGNCTGKSFTIKGINTLNYQDLEFNFGLSVNETKEIKTEIQVYFSTDNGTTWEEATLNLNNSGASTSLPYWRLISVTSNVPAASSLSVKFVSNIASKIRLDDIKVLGNAK